MWCRKNLKRFSFLVLLLAARCGDEFTTSENDPLATQSTNGAACDQTTWATFGQSFFSKNCVECHSFASSEAGVKAKSDDIAKEISSGDMPPKTKLSEADKSRALSYLACAVPAGKTTTPADDDDDDKEEEKPEALYCEACSDDSDCANNAICLAGAKDGDAFCGKTCKADKDCAADAKCYDIDDADGVFIGKSCYPVKGVCSAGTPGPTGKTGATWS